MSRRIDLDPSGSGVANVPPSQGGAVVAPVVTPAALAADADDRLGSHDLPGDHPAWMKDTLSLSSRARALFATLKPVLVRVVTVWEHRFRSLALPSGTLCIDASGSYRLR